MQKSIFVRKKTFKLGILGSFFSTHDYIEFILDNGTVTIQSEQFLNNI